MGLTGKQRRFLRSKSNQISKLIVVGGENKEHWLGELEEAFKTDRFVKVRAVKRISENRKAFFNELAEETGSELVQVMGYTALLYKVNKVLALDIGNVCVQLNFPKAVELLNISDATKFLDFVAESNYMGKTKRSIEDWIKALHQLTENRFSTEYLLDAWNTIVEDEIPEMERVIRKIAEKGFRIVFLSDTNSLHYDFLIKRLSFANCITGKILSYEVGCSKPDEMIFEKFEEVYGKPCYYTDDLERNIEAARSCGWYSHQFKSVLEFERDFFGTKWLL